VANKTMDRKKASMARSRAGAASPKAANTKAARPAVGKEEEEAKLKASRGATSTEVLETDEELVDEEAEDSAEAEDAAAADEDEEEATPRERRRKKRERGVIAVQPEDYAIARPGGKSAVARSGFVRYFVSSYRELLQVTWPTWQDTRNWTIVVILVAGSIGALLGAFDFGLAKFVSWWLSLAQK
jgi:preprotein translocase SecE subunit